MNIWRNLRKTIRALFQKPQLDTEMNEEMRSHIEMRTQENIEASMNSEEVRFMALRQFGWGESIKEKCRDQRFSMILFTLFSGIALLLAAIGIYGVMAYSVSRKSELDSDRVGFFY